MAWSESSPEGKLPVRGLKPRLLVLLLALLLLALRFTDRRRCFVTPHVLRLLRGAIGAGEREVEGDGELDR